MVYKIQSIRNFGILCPYFSQTESTVLFTYLVLEILLRNSKISTQFSKYVLGQHKTILKVLQVSIK